MEFRNSSIIRAAEYDRTNKTLDIVFSDGTCFTYFEVPDREYEGLVKAASVGDYFKKRIRAKYMCEERVRKPSSRAKKSAGTRKSRRTIH